MTNLTRDVLIKTIVADEMKSNDGIEYTKQLKNVYHKWEHESIEELCKQYNKIVHSNLTVDALSP
jgi:hypothetical protein